MFKTNIQREFDTKKKKKKKLGRYYCEGKS